MPEPTTYRDTDELIEAMRQAGWYCHVATRTDPIPRGLSRYDVRFSREAHTWSLSGGSVGAPTLRKAALKAASRALAALPDAEPAPDSGEAARDGGEGR